MIKKGASTAEIRLKDAYFVAMDKAIKRLSRAFKGTAIHTTPAENMMCPIMTRKTLEFAIIKAVFGESILFVADNRLIGDNGKVDYLNLFNTLQNDRIDLSKVKFVENAFSKYEEPNLMDRYFVPYWNHYDEYLKSAKKYLPADEQGKDVKVPFFGLYFDGIDYINYLPHPQTSQSGLHQVFVTLAATFSMIHKEEINTDISGGKMNIRKLYVDGVNENGAAAMNMEGTQEVYLDLLTAPPYQIGKEKTLPSDNYVKLFNTKVESINFKPADFTPFETKIRMAILVNLLNAIIPAKISPSKNVDGDPNCSLFSTTVSATAMNLKDYIYFKNGQYWVNNQSNSSGMPKYLKGWMGGIRTPGMTFWKYGVHSTTFQITVDAHKYDDAARLSAVVTFDSYDDTYDLEKAYNQKTPETVNNHSKPKYILTSAVKESPSVYSTIYLNPIGRADKNADNFVIGNGVNRYPTPTNTDSWKILSFVWSQPYANNRVYSKDYFLPIHLYPEDILNVGPAGGWWHFEPHSKDDKHKFTKFFQDAAGRARLHFLAEEKDFSTGASLSRKYSFGKNSWMQWPVFFSSSIFTNFLEIQVTREPGNQKSNLTMEHKLTLVNRKNSAIQYALSFSTPSSPLAKITDSYSIDVNPPVELPRGEYDIRLTELKDSDSTLEHSEKIIKIVIQSKTK